MGIKIINTSSSIKIKDFICIFTLAQIGLPIKGLKFLVYIHNVLRLRLTCAIFILFTPYKINNKDLSLSFTKEHF